MEIPKRKKRRFLPETFQVISWAELKPFYDKLVDIQPLSLSEFKDWLKDRSELESVVSEELGWRYIRMTCDTAKEEHTEAFEYFIREIEPNIAPYTNILNRKAYESTFLNSIEDPGYQLLRRNIEKDIKIFREENIPVLTEIQSESQKFGAISGAMTVEINGKELTLQQAGDFLFQTDRNKREEAYLKIQKRRLADKDQLDQLYSKLIGLRHRVAKNAGFDNFRDYSFEAMGRFDYTPQDCFDFHEAVMTQVVPILNELALQRKEELGLADLKPWDLKVDTSGKPPLKAFENPQDLINKTIVCFQKLNPYLAECISIMNAMGRLDLDSRKGKAPGGYNYPLAETNVPFIFMNATTNLRDLVTMLHEGGHAVHSFLTADLELKDFKNTPSEIAELASMAMELISMDNWDIFFENPDDLKRAKSEHLHQIIETLPWVATIDKFQHWVYTNPTHTVEERTAEWNKIFDQFSDHITDWDGLSEFKDKLWQKQLHLFEVPFYYIEYGMAQLGAIAVWKNYRENPKKGLEGYQNALKLGYTKPIAEVYAAAGIRFDFSKNYINELIGFVKQELY